MAKVNKTLLYVGGAVALYILYEEFMKPKTAVAPAAALKPGAAAATSTSGLISQGVSLLSKLLGGSSTTADNSSGIPNYVVSTPGVQAAAAIPAASPSVAAQFSQLSTVAPSLNFTTDTAPVDETADLSSNAGDAMSGMAYVN